jgi:uncharacterized delta-60 repeat protein
MIEFGRLVTDFGGADRALAAAVEVDGKIVVGGVSDGGFALARYDRNGHLDLDFDEDGLVTNDFQDVIKAMVFQGDGRVVAAGRTVGADFAVARYNSDGGFDAGFGEGGQVTTDFGAFDEANGVAVQPDGKTLAAGATGAEDFALARYNPDGSLDTSFDDDGLVTTDFGGNQDVAFTVAIQPDGKVVAAGSSSPDVFTQHFALVRYNPDGSLDTSFGGDGLVVTDVGFARVRALAFQTDGKILAAGDGSSGSVLVRYNPDGSLDTSFDGDGLVTVESIIIAAAVQSDGRIVVGGGAGDFVLARYNPDGSLDTSFDGDGLVATDIDGRTEAVNAIVIQPDQRMLAIGSAGNTLFPEDSDFALARYMNDAGESCDPKFWRKKKYEVFWSHTGISQSDSFNETFSVEVFEPDATLIEALSGKGMPTDDFVGNKHVGMMAEHGTAALLNAGHPEVAYNFEAENVMLLVQAGIGELETFDDSVMLELLTITNNGECLLE